MPVQPTTDSISTKQARLAELARQMPDTGLRSISHHIDLAWMREAHSRTRKDGATGVDGITADDYGSELEANLEMLLNKAKSGSYRAPPVRRVEIPKGKGKTRTLGIPTFEDKVLQRAVLMALQPVYEEDFYDFSYGFRPHRGAHDAVEALNKTLFRMKGGWVLEVDIQGFFDNLDHRKLRELLRKRIVDGVVVRLVGKWLRAGALEGGIVRRIEKGTPQGGVISPLLANIYLHEVLDRWWVEDVRPRMKGEAHIVRYADDFVMVFSRKSDADRVHRVLHKRFARFGLTLHSEKTRLVDFRRPPKGGGRKGTFDFLGFTHHWSLSGDRNVIKRKTMSSRMSRGLRALNQWMKNNRHLPVATQAKVIARKLQGHFAYYGIIGNSRAIGRFRWWAKSLWRKWLRRRSHRKPLSDKVFERICERYPLPRARLRPKNRQLQLAYL